MFEKQIETATSEKALKTYFSANKDKFSDEKVKASHILFKETDKATTEKNLKRSYERR